MNLSNQIMKIAAFFHWKRQFLSIFGKFPTFRPLFLIFVEFNRFWSKMTYLAFLWNLADFGYFGDFRRIQLISPINGYFCILPFFLQNSAYFWLFIRFWSNSSIFGKWRSIFLGRKRTLKNLSERSIETKSIGSARRKNSNFSWNNTLFWVV